MDPDFNLPGPLASDLWDRTNDRSIINLVPGKVAEAMLVAGKARPELFDLDEKALKRAVSPSPTDNRLRLAFWIEYDRAQAEQKNMNLSNVYGGVCTRFFFEEVWLKVPQRMAWLLCMPIAYDVALQESVAYGLDTMREILEMDHTTPRGVNAKLLELKVKVFAMLDMRLKGAYTQTLKNLNLNVSTSDKQVAKHLASGSMEEVEARLKYLQKKERQALNLPDLPGDSDKPAEVEVDSETAGA